jgi:basic membrane protein A and related proteins
MKINNTLLVITIIATLIVMLVSACTTTPPSVETPAGPENRVNVALILGGSANDMSWDYNAYITLKSLADQHDFINLMGVAENVAEGDSESFIRDYADKGANVIIANSFGFWDAAHKVTEIYPNLIVVFPGGDESLITDQVGTYYPLTYQSTYLVGQTAALMTKTGKVGYIVSNPIPPLLAETNSFVQGVRDTNPDAEVMVIITGSWYDPPRETEAAQALVDSGVDFIGFQLNALVTIDVSKKADIYVAPPFIDQSYLAPNNVAVSSLWNWTSYYEDLLTKASQGNWNSGVEYWGIDKGMADIELGPIVPEEVADIVMAKRQEIIDGNFSVPYIIDRNLWEE